MTNGLHVEVVWLDEHIVELRVRARNGAFAGCADCYESHDAFVRLAAALRGFPATTSDRRDVTVGAFDPGHAGGGVRLIFRVGPRGHAAVDVTVRAESGELASFTIPAEAAAIDAFVGELDRARISVGTSAALHQAT